MTDKNIVPVSEEESFLRNRFLDCFIDAVLAREPDMAALTSSLAKSDIFTIRQVVDFDEESFFDRFEASAAVKNSFKKHLANMALSFK